MGNLEDDGFRIVGAEVGDNAGSSVAGAGDVNGDRLADVIVGAPYADHNGRINSGSAYVVYGKGSSNEVDLLSLGSGGFRIGGAVGIQPGWPDNYTDRAGISVAGVGDINGGGYDDVVVGADGAYPRGAGSDGAAYVVYGGPAATNVDLAALGTRGIQMDGDGSDFNTVGWTVSGAGDFNGDGQPDVAVGSSISSYSSATSYSAYVVYGFAGGTDNLPNTSDVTPKKAQTTSGQPDSCTGAKYENRLELPREVRLSDLVKGKGIKAGVSANEASKATLRIEVEGEDALSLKLYDKKSQRKSKVVARADLKVSGRPKSVYLKASGKVRKRIKQALGRKKAPVRMRLKATLVTHPSDEKSLKRENTLTVRAVSRGRLKRAKTQVRFQRVSDRNGCGKSFKAKVQGPKQTELSSLTTRKGERGSGINVRVSCSEDCTTTVGYRLWGRYEVGLKFRKPGQKKPRVFSTRKVSLKAGESKTLRLEGINSKRLRMLLVRGAKKKRYKNIKFKYSVETLTEDGRSDSSAGTTKVRLKFN